MFRITFVDNELVPNKLNPDSTRILKFLMASTIVMIIFALAVVLVLFGSASSSQCDMTTTFAFDDFILDQVNNN
ncbi:hypothetical protein CDL15_Pgr023731 [Punica granatum]|uniref:Uncharacterized protein n=1 Tax=Punica granatum TaxID=22663 RepID=A0A218WS69_PUNGR|nr:hypothetical protein CDL15_Pgr023731 [Punica granatum]